MTTLDKLDWDTTNMSLLHKILYKNMQLNFLKKIRDLSDKQIESYCEQLASSAKTRRNILNDILNKKVS